jgi:hypothetical protein
MAIMARAVDLSALRDKVEDAIAVQQLQSLEGDDIILH